MRRPPLAERSSSSSVRSEIVLRLAIDPVRWNGPAIGLTVGYGEGQPVSLTDWMPRAILSNAKEEPAPEIGQVVQYGDYIYLGTPDGPKRAEPGDWFVPGPLGALYPCDSETFAADYGDEG